MTDKTTDKKTEADFSLNHFEQTIGSELEDSELFKEKTESTYTDDLFPDDRRDEQPVEEIGGSSETTWNTDQFTETDHEKKEPIIPDNPGFQTTPEAPKKTDVPAPGSANEQLTPDTKMKDRISATQTPSLTDDIPTPSSISRGSAIKPITIFAIVAMLSAATAVWLNPGVDNSHDKPVSIETATIEMPGILNTDAQIQHLEQRISSLEKQNSQEINILKQQVGNLEKQLASMNNLIAEQSKRQQSANRPQKQVKKNKPRKPETSAAAASPKAKTGWVVNLMSLDSLSAAKKALEDFKSKGINAEIGRYSAKGKTRYRIRVAGFASKQEAETQKKYLIRKYHLKSAWVHKP